MFHRSSTCGPAAAAKIVAAVVMVAMVKGVKVERSHGLSSFNPFYHGPLPSSSNELDTPQHAQDQDADYEIDQDPRIKLMSLLRRLAGNRNMWIQNGKR